MLAPGTQIAGYRIESMLGRGGMGAVYEATQLSLGRTVALKLLSAEVGSDEDFRERFRREGRIQAAIDHAHIVTVYEAGEVPEGLFIAMRLINGPNLKTLIRAGDLRPPRTMHLLRQVADALDAAHEASLMHRDIKPQNILVGKRDHAFLADFGLTKSAGDTGFTRTGEFLGTLDYVAPEQIHGEASPASDVYALAAVAYECLTGSVPFPRPTEAAKIFAQLSEQPIPASERSPGLPAAVDAVLAQGMAKAEGVRPPSATRLIDALESAVAAVDVDEAPTRSSPRVAAPTTVTSPRPEPPTTEPAPVPRRSRARLLGGLVALAAAGAAVGLGAGEVMSGEAAAPPPAGRALVAGAIAFTAPPGWRDAPAATPGIELRAARAVAGTRGSVAVGLSDGAGRYLLPDGFLRKVKPPPLADAAVRLGRLQAYRLRFDDQTLLVSPTSAGVATVVCRGVTAAECDRVAATLRLTGAVKPLPLGPRDDYAAAVRRVLSSLERKRVRLAGDLRQAGRASSQAKAASALAGAYERAAGDLRDVTPGPLERAAHAGLARAQARVAAAYDRLAAAARKRDKESYDAARARLRSAGGDLRAAMRRLEELDYALR